MAAIPNDYVAVFVPKQHLTKVYGFIASLDSPSSTEVRPLADRQTAQEWTPELIERQYRESPDSMKKFQKHLAAHPGQEFSTTEIAQAIGAKRGWNSVAGALGAYGRRVKNRYKRDSFPFQSRWEHTEGQQYHSMTPEVAEIIAAL